MTEERMNMSAPEDGSEDLPPCLPNMMPWPIACIPARR